MHIHQPKPVHGWRGLISEVGVRCRACRQWWWQPEGRDPAGGQRTV